MKIKAMYNSKVGNKSIIVGNNTFLNGHAIVVDVEEDEAKQLRNAAKQDWFNILAEYDSPDFVEEVKSAPVVEEPIVAEPVIEEAPVEESVPEVVEESVEEAPVEESVEEVPAPEVSTEEETEEAPKKKGRRTSAKKKEEEATDAE